MIDTKALREKILDLAIRGKLVPQDPNDEPASVLLERIRAQKQQMVKEGKLKAKDIKNDTIIFKGEDNLHYEQFQDGTVKCIEDEIPFDVPDGWAWCRYSDVIELYSGQDLTPEQYNDANDGIPYITGASNLEHGKVIINRWTPTPTTHATTGDLLLTVKGSGVGKMAFCDIADAHIARQIMALRCTGAIKPQYLYIAISAMLRNIISQANGIIPGIRREIVLEALLPLPPFSEQERICEKVNCSLFVVDTIDNDKDGLFECIQNIKSKILDLAIRGKLVPQDPNDEPASVLLERIKVEKEELIKQGKIKRDKKESVIFKGEDNSYYEKIGNSVACIDDELPFEIPSSWIWCRLGEIFSHNTGKALNSSNTTGYLMTYITTSNLYWNRFVLDSLKKMRFSENEIEKCTVRKGDLLVCEGGDIGRAAIWEHDEEIRIQNHIHKLRPYAELSISNRFYYYIFYLWKQMGRIGGHGIGLQGFSSRVLHNLIIPLPPFKEQLSIVSKIDCLFSILEGIEKSLN